MRKTMSSVGSSTLIGGKATGFSMSAMVSPMSDILEADHGADVAGLDLVGLRAAQAIEDVELGDLALDLAAVPFEQGDALILADLAGDDPADGDSADVIAVVERDDRASAAARPGPRPAAARASG